MNRSLICVSQRKSVWLDGHLDFMIHSIRWVAKAAFLVDAYRLYSISIPHKKKNYYKRETEKQSKKSLNDYIGRVILNWFGLIYLQSIIFLNSQLNSVEETNRDFRSIFMRSSRTHAVLSAQGHNTVVEIKRRQF